MSIALKWNTNHASLYLENNTLATKDDLETAIIISLFTDDLANKNDELPETQTNRRGWWGNCLQNTDDKIGSKLWLLSREKQQQFVVKRAEDYARDALRWLIEENVAEKVDVVGSIPRVGWLNLAISIYRPDGKKQQLKFQYNWQAQKENYAL